MFQFTHSIFSHFKLSNKRINFTFHVREKKEYSKIILFIYFYSILFPPPKQAIKVIFHIPNESICEGGKEKNDLSNSIPSHFRSIPNESICEGGKEKNDLSNSIPSHFRLLNKIVNFSFYIRERKNIIKLFFSFIFIPFFSLLLNKLLK